MRANTNAPANKRKRPVKTYALDPVALARVIRAISAEWKLRVRNTTATWTIGSPRSIRGTENTTRLTTTLE